MSDGNTRRAEEGGQPDEVTIDDLEADSAEQTRVVGVGDNSLAVISDLAFRALDVEREIKDMEKRTSELKERLRDIVGIRLPQAMGDADLEKFVLSNGFTVSVRREVYPNLSKDRLPKAMEWLRTNGHGDIIKNNVTLSFPPGHDGDVDKVRKLAKELSVSDVSVKETVHTNTLKAFLKSSIESGEAVPLDLFGAYLANIAIIKAPRKKGTKKGS